MAVKEKNKIVQTDEISRESGREIDEIFLFTENDTRGLVVSKHENDTPGFVDIDMEKSGSQTSLKKTDGPLFFRREKKRGLRGEI